MFRRLTHLFNNVFRRFRVEDELHEEIDSNFQMLVERYIARGMSLDEAIRAARLEFEGMDQRESAIIWRDRLCIRPRCANWVSPERRR
jgi:hypothetical protein